MKTNRLGVFLGKILKRVYNMMGMAVLGLQTPDLPPSDFRHMITLQNLILTALREKRPYMVKIVQLVTHIERLERENAALETRHDTYSDALRRSRDALASLNKWVLAEIEHFECAAPDSFITNAVEYALKESNEILGDTYD